MKQIEIDLQTYETRIFANITSGRADGIKIQKGKLLVGFGLGIVIYDLKTRMIDDFINVTGGCANFAIIEDKIFILNEKRILMSTINSEYR